MSKPLSQRHTMANEFAQLASLGLKIEETVADGNCLFNALSDQLYGNQGRNREIRLRVCHYMKTNPADYICFFAVDGERRTSRKTTKSSFKFEEATSAQTNSVWEAYLEKMQRDGTWGGEQELLAFTRAYGVTIHLYQGDSVTPRRYEASEPLAESRVVHLAFHGWEHYSSVRRIDGSVTVVPTVNDKPRRLSSESSSACSSSDALSPATAVTTPTASGDNDSSDEEELPWATKPMPRPTKPMRSVSDIERRRLAAIKARQSEQRAQSTAGVSKDVKRVEKNRPKKDNRIIWGAPPAVKSRKPK